MDSQRFKVNPVKSYIKHKDITYVLKIQKLITLFQLLTTYKSTLANLAEPTYEKDENKNYYIQTLQHLIQVKQIATEMITFDLIMTKIFKRIKLLIKKLTKRTIYKKKIKQLLKYSLIKGPLLPSHLSLVPNHISDTYFHSIPVQTTNFAHHPLLLIYLLLAKSKWFLKLVLPTLVQNVYKFKPKKIVFKSKAHKLKKKTKFALFDKKIKRNRIRSIKKYKLVKIRKKRKRKKRVFIKSYPSIYASYQSRWSLKNFKPLVGKIETQSFNFRKKRKKQLKRLKRIKRRMKYNKRYPIYNDYIITSAKYNMLWQMTKKILMDDK
jgi:hypothetical protein